MQKISLFTAAHSGFVHDLTSPHWRWRCTDPPDARV